MQIGGHAHAGAHDNLYSFCLSLEHLKTDTWVGGHGVGEKRGWMWLNGRRQKKGCRSVNQSRQSLTGQSHVDNTLAPNMNRPPNSGLIDLVFVKIATLIGPMIDLLFSPTTRGQQQITRDYIVDHQQNRAGISRPEERALLLHHQFNCL